MRRTIAFIADNLFLGFQERLWAGVRKAAEDLDVNLLCFVTGYNEVRHPGRRVFDLVDPSRLTGIVALSGSLGPTEEDLRASFARFGEVPFVGLGRTLEGVTSFLVDNHAGMCSVVDHLIEVHGRREIAFLRGPEDNEEAAIRFAAYRESLARHGIAEDPRRVLPGDFVPHSGADAAGELLARGVRFDALVAANDYAAMSAAQELQRRGISIPEHVSLAGFDDVGEAAGFTPGLTTVRQPFFEMSRDAVLRILRAADGDPLPETVRFAGELVVRRSCGCEPRWWRSAPHVNPAPTIGTADLVVRLEVAFPSLGARVGDPAWARRLAGALRDALDRDDPRPLCESLSALLRAGHPAHVYVSHWLDVLDTALREVVADRPALEERTPRLREAAQRTLAVTSEQVYQAAEIVLRRDTHVLRRAWINPADPEEVWRVLREQLPTMEVPSFYYSSFLDPWAGQARLEFHYSCTDTVALGAGRRPFLASQLVPGVLTEARRHAFVVMPIRARGTERGFMVCEVGPMGGPGYENLVGQLSAAAELRALLAEVRGYATDVETRAEQRTTQLREAQRLVVDTAHRAGMAEVAVGLTHNLGNLLTSVGVSTERILDVSDGLLLGGIVKSADLLSTPEDRVALLKQDGRVELLAEYLRRAAEDLSRAREAIRAEAGVLSDRVGLIRETVRMLQEYARGEDLRWRTLLDVGSVIETALHVQESTLSRYAVRVVRDLFPVPLVLAERSTLVHVFVNLVKNGVEAMRQTPDGRRVLSIQLRRVGDQVEVRITDAGEGIPEAHLLRIFEYGFTTKQGGHGFGLHTCANHLAQIGGTIHAESAGCGQGATFVVRLPAAAPPPTHVPREA